ncbi:MAG: hypothetical protein Kow0026_24820 [Oricola sp.]
MLVFSTLLLSQLPSQTRWVAKTEFFAQPRFWPAAGLVAMVVFGALHLYTLPWRRFRRADWLEARKWASALEYAAWFMGYVVAVPVAGYLPSTLVFVPVLARRLGYRSRRMMLASILFGLVTVVVFKSFLEVKIPGGMLYEYLPGAIRNFFILNF